MTSIVWAYADRAHPFFIGTLFVPQAGSRAGHPHPLVTAFVRAALAQKTA